jgi:flagellar biosynthesis regulator FlaF
MNARAAAAYGAVQRATRAADPRGAEADLLRRRAADIEGAASPLALARALEAQRNLWTALAADLMAPANALPEPLRQRLLGIAHWILADLDAETPALAAQVAINRQLALGLGGDAGA